MSTIRILPEEVSNRIAAGEVVERPASVIKELVENSLDAGASQISIQVTRGGRTLIQVTDDGIGMDSEDALLCLEAHATSKIKTASDIEMIDCFGFRGEALPSIASVSHMSIRTKPEDCGIGTEILIDGGVIRSISEVGSPTGTTITVKSIFYNLPARRKFLRNVNTEEFHIQETVLLQALSNPAVGFQLSFDNRAVILVQKNHDLSTRATMLLGKDTMSEMLPVEYCDDEMKISGLVARPGLSRTSRKEQRIFVNGRAIDSNTIYYALRDAYHTLVMKGRYPPVLLFLEVNPKFVDVNVHPAKREVRFRNDRLVGQFVAAGVQRALRGLIVESAPLPGPERRLPSSSIPAPVFLPPETLSTESPVMPTVDGSVAASVAAPVRGTGTPSKVEGGATDVARSQAKEAFPLAPDETLDFGYSKATGPSVSAANPAEISQLRVLGAIANLFLIAEGSEGLVLIDQHAAHERVLYEKVLKQAISKDGTQQGLLIPITVDLSNADTKILNENLEDINKIGFGIENFGGNTFIINGVPPHFPQENIGGMLRDMIDELRDSPLMSKRVDEARIARTACKAAVKAHDPLSDAEIRSLLDEMLVAEMPYTCPHGRPTMINISFTELEKRFGRRQ